jgi:hypothetical protein
MKKQFPFSDIPSHNLDPNEMIKWRARTERTAFVVRKEIRKNNSSQPGFGVEPVSLLMNR